MKNSVASSRPAGRLFYCLISMLLAVGVSRGVPPPTPPATTTISDVIYRADGSTAAGTLLITWPAFTTADNRAVPAGSMSLAIGAFGAINLALVPNQGATPAGTYYKVVMKLNDGTTSQEFWVVPTLSPTTIAAMRSQVVPAGVALQVVTRQYVDDQLATKADNASVVHRTGDESVAGVKQFTASPTVPTPTADPAAANKAYVDAAVASVSATNYVLKSGDTMTGLLTLSGNPTQPLHASTKSYVDTQVGTRALDSAVVHLTGAETITGVKAFSASPTVPTPTTDTAAANKAYVDTVSGSPSSGGVRFADQFAGADAGAKINAAYADLPTTGGTIYVPSTLAGSFATGIVVGAANKAVHLMFDCGQWTYTGTVAAITISSTSGSGTVIEGCAPADENTPLHGTSITSSNTAAGGIDMQNCQDCIVRNISLVGPASGTGIGANMSGNGFVMESVEVDSFGGDGVRIDGTRANSNSFALRRVRSHGNLGNGFNVFGVNSNLGTWISTNALTNAGTQYVFNGTFSHSFIAVHAQASTDVTAMQFIGASSNWGSVYIEPVTPFAANAITLDATSNNNNLHLLNGRKVSDQGTANLVFFAATDAGAEISGWYNGIRNNSPAKVINGTFNPVESVQRATTNAELSQQGIFFKSANNVTGWTRTSKVSLNWIYNTSGGSNAARWFNNCTGDLSLCSPVFSADTVFRATNAVLTTPNIGAATAASITATTLTMSGGTVDSEGATVTRPFRRLAFASFPATCTANREFLERSDPAAAGQVVYVCNSTGNGWDLVGDGGGGGGANTSLSNLAAVAVNASLVPGLDNAIDLGSSLLGWKDLYAKGVLNAGSVDASTGYRVGGAAASGNVLRGNGTNFVGATLACADVTNCPSLVASGAAGAGPSKAGTASTAARSDHDHRSFATLTWYFPGTPSTGVSPMILAVPQGIANGAITGMQVTVATTSASSSTFNLQRCTAGCTGTTPTFSDIYSSANALNANTSEADFGTTNLTSTLSAKDQFKANLVTIGSGLANVTITLSYKYDTTN